MSAIGKGDWVECFKGPDWPPITVGSVWYVEWVSAGTGWHHGADGAPPEPCKGSWLSLTGAGDRWCSCSFRPIYRPKAELIERLKAPAPEMEPA